MDPDDSMAKAMEDVRREMNRNLQVASHNLMGQMWNAQANVQAHMQHAQANFHAQMQRVQADLAAKHQRAANIDQLQIEVQHLKNELEQKDAELEAQRATIATLQQAHAKLDAKARKMKSWISHARKELPQFKVPTSLEPSGSITPISMQKAANSPNGEATTMETSRPQSNSVAKGASSNQGGLPTGTSIALSSEGSSKASKETNEDCTRVDSDPAAASTESAPSEPSQSLPETTKRKAESDSDVPQVVFERKLKRKRSKKSPYIKPEPQSPNRSSQTTQAPSATLDLDEVSLPLGTDSTQSESSHSVLATGKKRAPHSLRSQAIEWEDSNVTPLHSRVDIHEDPKEQVVTANRATEVETEQSDQASFISSFKQQNALQPKTPNEKLGTPISGIRSTLGKRSSRHENGWTDIFGEDGTGDENDTGENLTHLSLEDLLNNKAKSDAAKSTPKQRLQTPRLSKQKSSARSAKSVRAQPSKTRSTALRRSLPPTEPRMGLRTRALESLRLDDFKLNPMRNQGADFAFSEVVRNRDQRSCLPGCTKPDCCGNTFSRAVQIGGYSTPSRSGLGDALRGKDRSEDDRLLRNYLGDAASRLEFMSGAEKAEHLLKARTAAFGQNHGKHRHLHARPPSPVGFWRTDMPSTQENLDDKEKAQMREHDKIRERWREAMRPNGLWMFRDENPSSA